MRDASGKKIPSLKVQNKKAVRDFLMGKAHELPITYEDHPSYIEMTGAELLDRNDLLAKWTKEQIEAIDVRKKYKVPATLTRRINHYQRMLNLCKSKGIDAAVQYYNEVRTIGLESLKIKNIGNLTTEVDHGSVIRNY